MTSSFATEKELFLIHKNSLHDPKYENINRGKLQYFPCYSEHINNFILRMVNPDFNLRPTAARIISSSDINPAIKKSRFPFFKQLRETRKKLMILEEEEQYLAENRHVWYYFCFIFCPIFGFLSCIVELLVLVLVLAGGELVMVVPGLTNMVPG